MKEVSSFSTWNKNRYLHAAEMLGVRNLISISGPVLGRDYLLTFNPLLPLSLVVFIQVKIDLVKSYQVKKFFSFFLSSGFIIG